MLLLFDRIDNHAQRNGHSFALEKGEQRLSYLELNETITRIGALLANTCRNTDARVAVYGEKSIEAVITILGAMQTGYCAVPINPRLKNAQALHILRDSGAEILVTDQDRFERVAHALDGVQSLHTVILTNANSNTRQYPATKSQVINWDQFLCFPADPAPTARQPDENLLACLLYTSGSSGFPKGVMLSHKNLYLGAESVSEFLQCKPTDRILALLPLSFDYGLNQLTHAFFSGATAVLYDYLLAGDVWNTLVEQRITGLAGIPTLWHALTQTLHAQSRKTHLRYLTNSGGRLSLPLLKQLKSNFPSVKIYSMYGVTEAFRSTCLDPAELEYRPASIGTAIRHAELFVLDEHDQLCKPGETGQFVHSGPLVTMGYWNRPPAPTKSFAPLPAHLQSKFGTSPSAFWTGDLGFVDDSGYFYFVGRKDEMIKTSGFRVSPTEIECMAKEITGVIDAVAFGIEHKQRGQDIVLAIQSNLPVKTMQTSTREWFHSNASSHLIPKHIFVFNDMPITPNGKPDRILIRQRLTNEILSAT